LNHLLWNPNQLHNYGAKVYDCPKQFDLDSKFVIEFKDEDGDPFIVPLRLNGIIQYINTHNPTDKELATCRWIVVTSDQSWDPYSKIFEENEEAAHAFDQHRQAELQCHTRRVISAVSVESDGTLFDHLCEHVNTPDPSHEDLLVDGDSGRNENADFRQVDAVSTDQRASEISDEVLARRWGIGLQTAKRTLRVTTQAGVRRILHPVERRFRTRRNQLKFPTSSRLVYSDTMFPQVKSVNGKTCAQVYTDGLGWDHFYPMKARSEAGDTLDMFVQENQWIPQVIVTDGAMEQVGGTWPEIRKKWGIRQRLTEPYSPWQNRAESSVYEIKKAIKRMTRRSGSPKRLWNYLGEHVAAIRRLTAHDFYGLDGQVPEALYRGGIADISEYIQFDWYQYVWYFDQHKEKHLGRWIGVAKDVGAPMTFWILPKSGIPIPRSSVTSLTPEEMGSDGIKEAMRVLDEGIKEKIGDHLKDEELLPELGNVPAIDDGPWDLEEEVDEPVEPEMSKPEADEWEDPEMFDKYIGAEINLNRGGQVLHGKVVGRKRDSEGNPVGHAANNPLLDTREYDVEFIDGSTEAYSTNLIAEAMYSQVDDEGRSHVLLKEITDHRKDGSAVEKDDAFFVSQSGRRCRRRTTKGWELNVTWKDGSSSWLPLRELKDSFPVQVAEYAVANKIAEEAAFAW